MSFGLLRVGVISFALSVLSACQPSDPLSRFDKMSIADRSKTAASDSLLTQYLSGNTIWGISDAKDGGHGTQVEFHSKQGRVFLWYPMNTRLVTGQWEVRTNSAGKPNICYKYQSNSFNPMTGQLGGDWECSATNWVRLGDAIQGDPFGLASGRLPFAIPDRGYYAPGRLMAMANKDPRKVQMITTLSQLEK
jgi:hypothetical protein